MAGRSLGTLTIDLVAKVGGFVSGMDKAERASAKWSKQVQDDAAASSAALAGVGAAAVTAGLAVGAAGFQLLKSTSKQITETDRWAKSLNVSTQELLAWQFAAEKAGVSGDQMADIFKDIGDKIGDAVLNKSGEAVDALNSLGLSAEKLSRISPDKQLLVIGEALGKIGTNAEKTTILESLGNDLSKLLPLFDNNNEKLKQFIFLAKDYGVAPDPSSIDDLVKVNQLFEDMEAQVAGLKMEIAAGLAKVDLSPLQSSLDKLHDVLTDPAVLQGISDLVSEVTQLAGWLVKAAAGAGQLAASTGNRFAALSGKIDLNNIDQVNERITYLQKQVEGRKDIYSQDASMFGWLTGVDDSAKALNDELSSLIATRDKLSKPTTGNLPLAPATIATGNPYSLPPGGTNGKPTKAPVDKVLNAFKSVEQSYLRQLALTDQLNGKTKEATELEKLRFDISSGKLSGITQAQRLRLEGLASEIDKYKLLEKYYNLQQELLTPEERFLEITKERIKLLKEAKESGLAKPDDYSKAAKAIANNAFEAAPEFSGIDPLFGGQSGELRKVDNAQKELEDWYSTQLNLLAEYRQSQSELNDEWDAKDLALKKKHDESLQALNDQRNQLMLSSISDGLGSMVDLTKEAFGEQSAIYKAAFVAQKAVAIAQSIIAIQQGIAMASANPFPYNLAAMASVAAATAGIVSNISAVGMAHDGIDAVPETGTWLLQKGERVTTAATSAKLDATLDRVANQSTGGGTIYSPTITIPINGNPSDATLALVRKAADEGAERGYQKAVNSVASGQGDLHKALMGKTTSGRKIS
ncbi:phage tail tape measure protein [Klebsiella pneumoniae]|uniref:phage tail tape measure protein n=1 Tax=Klebsiella pneumoniae TaxID=573 RepID=UPI000E2A517A|nr:phage tail tape measure protein [Klebsiella pneumoniae]MCD5782115.1 phage tail tape measure protein [Klebsiella pneumoniae]SXZ13658.1 Prophage tail length tape measure [Klebsiella pneumoniae]HBR3734624.1 phage tail tape measure protein [Klebsiella pneumoniae]HBT0142168.1 phage tail tape measure protein [Klebsiella pneumoniae]HBT3832831.1 phage tail tape measure protein [Klebsiella pneumoniae]